VDFIAWLEYGLGNLSSPMRADASVSKYDTDAQGRPTPAAVAASVDYGPVLSLATVNNYNGTMTLIYPHKISVKKAKYDARNYGAQQLLNQFSHAYDYGQIFEKVKVQDIKHDAQGIKITINIPSEKEFKNAVQKYPAGVLMKI
jgi:hypothetical protein